MLSYEDNAHQTSNKRYNLPTIEIKDYNVMIDGRNFFDQPIGRNFMKTHENVRKIPPGRVDDCITGCLLNYPYFKKTYKMIAVDLSKQQALDADPRATQEIIFTGNLDRAGNTIIVFSFGESKGAVRVLKE